MRLRTLGSNPSAKPSNPMRQNPEGRHPSPLSHPSVPQAHQRSPAPPPRSRKAPTGHSPLSPQTPAPYHTRDPIAHGPPRYAPTASHAHHSPPLAARLQGPRVWCVHGPSTRSLEACRTGYPTALSATGAGSKRQRRAPLFRRCYHWPLSPGAPARSCVCRSWVTAYPRRTDRQPKSAPVRSACLTGKI